MAAASLHQRVATAPSPSCSLCLSSGITSRQPCKAILLSAFPRLIVHGVRHRLVPQTLFVCSASSYPHNAFPFPDDHTSIQENTQTSCSSPQPCWRDWSYYQVYDEKSRDFRHGPLPGDLGEVEAFCRIFRLAEQVHNAIMEALLVFSQSLLCKDHKDVQVKDAFLLEDKVVSALGRIGALLHQQRQEVLGGRLSLDNSLPDSLPPLSRFRAEMHRHCKDLDVTLYECFPLDDEKFRSIHKAMHRLVNACFDAGYARTEDEPDHADIPNWGAVHLHVPNFIGMPKQGFDSVLWRGGRFTEEGLQWLIGKGFKAILDLRAEAIDDQVTNLFVQKAVSSGLIMRFWLPVNQGSSPSRNQVLEFARLSSDPQNHPLYFHSQVGWGRTFSLVSRLHEFSSRSDFEKGTVITSKEMQENSMIYAEKELLSFSASATGATKKNDTNESIINGNNVCESLGKQGDCSSIAIALPSPFEAQRPVLPSLSKHALSKFLKGRQVSPANFQSSGKLKKTVNLNATYSGEAKSVKETLSEPAGRWGLDGPGIPRAGRRDELLTGNGYINASSIEGREVETADSDMLNGALFQVTDFESREDADEAVVSNMCASTTGVVRLQSRKKAEMYLVRTDGFSCAREKVKESSLAFTHPSTQQQMLMWKTAPRTVLLLKKLGDELMQAAQQVASFLHYQEGMNVVVEPEVHDHFARIPGFGFIQTYYNEDTSNLHERVDLVVCLGGDGVILHASNLFRNAVPPIVSFNLGSLGFLTAHLFKDFMQDLRAIIHGNSRVEGVYITLRMRLRCELFRNRKPVPGKVFEVLNEVVLDRGSSPYLCKIECYERNRLITKVQADGVIVATPTGSTAYSTSAGGSMVHPNVPCMLFTPICPHSLSFRPVILPDSALLELKVPEDARSNVWVSFDGKKRQQLSRGDSVQICMSEHPLPTVNKSDQTDDWFRSLVRCLNWNERLEQKGL